LSSISRRAKPSMISTAVRVRDNCDNSGHRLQRDRIGRTCARPITAATRIPGFEPVADPDHTEDQLGASTRFAYLFAYHRLSLRGELSSRSVETPFRCRRADTHGPGRWPTLAT
jgi:hypothetical protein